MKHALVLAAFTSLLALSNAAGQPVNGVWYDNAPIIDARDLAASPQVTRTLAWNGRDALNIEVPAEVTYVRGSAPRLELSGAEVLVNHVDINTGEVRMHVSLRCYRDCDFNERPPLRLTITAPSLDSLRLGLGARTRALNISQKAFALKLSTGARADLTAQVDDLDLDLSSGAQLTASGRAKSTQLNVSSCASANLARLAIDEAVVHASAAANAVLSPRRSAEVHASAVAKVHLLNRPPQLNVRASAMADVTVDGE